MALDALALQRIESLFEAQPSAAEAPPIGKAICDRLTPLSIAGCRAAVYHAETQTYSLWQQELQHVRVVARLAEAVATRQLLKATLEDHTGQLVACMTRLGDATATATGAAAGTGAVPTAGRSGNHSGRDDDGDYYYNYNDGIPQLNPMQHVVATGVLTGATASERGIDLAHIANISDGNALTHHLLEIVLCHLQRTRGLLPVGPTSSRYNYADSRSLTLFNGPGVQTAAPQTLTYIQQRVLETCAALDDDPGSHGVTVEQAQQGMLGLASSEETAMALDHLCRSGYLYTVSGGVFRVCAS